MARCFFRGFFGSECSPGCISSRGKKTLFCNGNADPLAFQQKLIGVMIQDAQHQLQGGDVPNPLHARVIQPHFALAPGVRRKLVEQEQISGFAVHIGFHRVEPDIPLGMILYPEPEGAVLAKLTLAALVTNFHLPQSTLIMLVSALAGREHVLHAYEEAVKEKYRFFSFGDAMFIS